MRLLKTNFKLQVIFVDNVFRQDEERLTAAVRELSRGRISSETCQLFESLKEPIQPPFPKPVHLYSTNYDVDLCNERHLKTTTGKVIVFQAKDQNISSKFLSICPVVKNLKLKKLNVPVILFQTVSKFLCNGRIGIVKQMSGSKVSVLFGSQLYEIEQVTFAYPGVCGVRVQFPLRLSFALTVHRAQGLSLEKVVIHCENMHRPGQLGVALGRAKKLSGIQIEGFSDEMKIEQHPQEVENFYRRVPENCNCNNTALSTHEFVTNSQTTASQSSQETEPQADTTEDMKFEDLCSSVDSSTKFANKADRLRRRLKRRPASVNQFVQYVREAQQKNFEECVGKYKVTNKRETAFFASFHRFTLTEEFKNKTAQLFDKESPSEEAFSISFEIASSVRDAVIAQRLPIDKTLQAFLPAQTFQAFEI